MTNEEAAEYLKERFCDDGTKWDMAFRCAIEALQAADADGCDGCKYVNKDEYEMPCLVCKRNHMDKWRPCE